MLKTNIELSQSNSVTMTLPLCDFKTGTDLILAVLLFSNERGESCKHMATCCSLTINTLVLKSCS